MDLTITSKSWGIDAQDWLASRFGLDTGRSITLDVSTFTQADHYPDGFLKSGLPLAPNADGVYGLATSECDGHLLKPVHVGGYDGNPVSETVAGALYWQGVVDARFLPVPDGPQAPRVRYENVAAAEAPTVPEGGA